MKTATTKEQLEKITSEERIDHIKKALVDAEINETLKVVLSWYSYCFPKETQVAVRERQVKRL